ncbi:electron transport complex subunit RsxC [Agarivorans sp. QJM3NY_25]|uniref:electron transport complex subunit RsxC n=1 Tax=Agarivorans sp. QJM3NY_25 TaxID=3421430 RepID=UPI003D7DC133
MVAWLEKIKQGFTWNYQGGVHPETNKQLINCEKPEWLANPEYLTIPVQQHIGSAAKLLVVVGQKVLRGQALNESQFYQAPPVHASCSGTIVAIEPRVTAHASAIPELAIVIKVDEQQRDAVWPAPLSQNQQTPELICQRVHQSGIAGMGGAGFPTALKISPHKPLDILIINGAECEPYITADDCLMRNYPAEVIKGVQILQTALQPKLTIIAIENDKPEAIEALSKHTNDSIIIRSIPTKYPSGGEKQLIEILTGQQVTASQLPIDLGMLVQNVGTAYAVHRAVDIGEPLISRIVTIAGDLVEQPANYWLPLGTSVAHILSEKLQVANNTPTIMGGSMMGFMLPNNQAPIVKTSNCLIVNHPQAATTESPCIRCGECAQACPMGLLPQQLYWFSQADELNKARSYNMMDCIECGACAFVCPSQISLVQHYRTAKAKIRAEDLAKQEADIAKQRFEARLARLEKDKLERKAKHQQAALRRQEQTNANSSANKPDPVAAALARVKQSKSQAPAAIQTTSGEWIPDNQQAIAEREARKQQRRLAKEQGLKASSDSNETQAESHSDKAKSSNPAVAAAIARAKAKKLAATDTAQTETPVADDAKVAVKAKSSNPAVAAAIARAKAKKLAATDTAQTETPVADDAKVAVKAKSTNPAVAAAIARAKAKKLAATDTAQTEMSVANDTKVAVKAKSTNPAVAAAIARAKAKKLAATDTAQTEMPVADDAKVAATTKSTNPAVAAAVARAKAKKLAATDAAQTETSVANDTKVAVKAKSTNPAVAAAIARAKAKKLAATDTAQTEMPVADDAKVTATTKSTNPAVAAAVARAKAKAKKRAEQTKPQETKPNDQ